MFDTAVKLTLAWLILLLTLAECSTHWKVTESGRLESKEEATFTLLRPYDLATLLKQVNRAKYMQDLKVTINKRDAISRQDHATSKERK
jgi:hypothetical protein